MVPAVARVKVIGPGARLAGRLIKMRLVPVFADAVSCPSGVGYPRASVHVVTHEVDVMRIIIVTSRRRQQQVALKQRP